MVEHYAAGEGQGEEAPKVTSSTRAAGFLSASVLRKIHASRQYVTLADCSCCACATCSSTALALCFTSSTYFVLKLAYIPQPPYPQEFHVFD